MRRSGPHPLEGTALTARRPPRLARPAWERRVAAGALGDAFSRPRADPGAAMRGAAAVSGALLLPVALVPGFEAWPLALLGGAVLAAHHRCRRPRELLRAVGVAWVVHVPAASVLEVFLHG